jgi:hypothetical protein
MSPPPPLGLNIDRCIKKTRMNYRFYRYELKITVRNLEFTLKIDDQGAAVFP